MGRKKDEEKLTEPKKSMGHHWACQTHASQKSQREREKEAKRIFEETMVRNLQNLIKYMNVPIQEAQ